MPPKKDPTGDAFKLRIRVMRGDTVAIGPGKIELLEALEQTHSISAAAKSIGMSYRRAWLLIDELNAALRTPAVASATGGQHGGGSALTPTGRKVLALYRQIEAESLQASRATRASLLRLLAD